MRCPYCNSELSNDYCPKCGKKVYAPGNPTLETVTIKKKKSAVGSFIIMILLLGIFAGVLFYTMDTLNKEGTGEKNIYENKEMVSVLSEYGVPKYLSGNITKEKVNGVSSVYTVLASLSNLYNFENPKNEFNISSFKSEGITHYRMEQLYNGIKVYGHELVMSVNEYGEVLSITGDYVPIKKLSNYSTLKENEISDIVKEHAKENTTILSRERIIILDGNDGLVAYLVYAYNDSCIFEYVVNASSGEIINVDSDIVYNINYKYSGSGLKTNESINLEEYQDVLLDKVRYKFIDNSRNIEIIDGSKLNTLYSNNSQPIIGDMQSGEISINNDEKLTTSSVNAMNVLSQVYDYYYNFLGRKSYDGNGSKISLFVHANSNSDTVEAHYNRLTNQIFLGLYNEESLSDIKSLVAHEFTHAVISNSSKLGENLDNIYNNVSENQSGALNEAYSDILGLIIESKSFVLGQDSVIENYIGRDLSNPSKYDKPSKVNGDNYYPSLNGKSVLKYLEDNNMESLYEFDNGGVHINSTVVGHAAYLGFKNNAYDSREEMARVWYNSLLMLTPTSDYEDCALAVIKTAENLGLSEKSIEIIKNAFIETNVLSGGTHKLSGTVMYDGEVLSNVKISVTLVNETDTKFVKGSNKEGVFEFTDLKEGTYDLIFSRDGYEDVTKRVILNKDYDMTVELVKK